ncbi:unnamed protein product, partial [Discosporangium mesarthrocarpum]
KRGRSPAHYQSEGITQDHGREKARKHHRHDSAPDQQQRDRAYDKEAASALMPSRPVRGGGPPVSSTITATTHSQGQGTTQKGGSPGVEGGGSPQRWDPHSGSPDPAGGASNMTRKGGRREDGEG